jgi:tRNA (guanosine-2'-O-)-methyltransferase
MQIVLAHESTGAEDFRAVDYTRPTAIVLGAERDGPSSAAIAGADRHVRLPMAGMVASLNVSAASAVILYEAQRQRSVGGLYQEPRLDPATYWRLVVRLGYPEVARRCDARGLPYPVLDERDGSIAAFPETRSTG